MRIVGWLAFGALLAGCVNPHFEETIEDEQPLKVAAAMVSADPYTDLVIQVHFMRGTTPTAEALQDLLSSAEGLTCKRHVTLMDPVEIASSVPMRKGASWTLAELSSVHGATFILSDPRALGNGTSAFLHVLYLDSDVQYQYLNRTVNAVGVEIRNAIFVFSGAKSPNTQMPVLVPGTARDRLILVHEFGHAMGLLNLGAPLTSPHALPEDPYHSRNADSVMHGAVDILTGTRVDREATLRRGSALFDDDDLADLSALRGGCAHGS